MAADRRLAGLVFDISAAPSAAGELRSYGLAPRLKALHASLTGTLDRRAAREARQVLAVQSAGWLLYAAGLMARDRVRRHPRVRRRSSRSARC